MKIKNKYFLTFFLGFSTLFYSQSSNLKKVKSIEYNYQKCLDDGVDMLDCSNKYYFFNDKLLNEVYQIVRLKLKPDEKKALKTDQLKWLKNRDAYFKKAYIEAKNESEGLSNQDLQMVFIDKKADYVKKRVVFLINKYKI
jgi:uncharacterized protein YecT (DUF1311 family)